MLQNAIFNVRRKGKRVRNGVLHAQQLIRQLGMFRVVGLGIIKVRSGRGQMVYTLCNRYVKRPSTFTHQQFYYVGTYYIAFTLHCIHLVRLRTKGLF